MWTIPNSQPSEYDDIRIVEDHIQRLVKYAEDFSSALSLFNFCEMYHHQITGDWSFVPARDGAMTIYHIGKTIELTRAAIKRSPSLAKLVDIETLSQAGKKFRSAFPTFEKVRHAVSHSSELFRDKESTELNASKTGYVGPGIHAPNVTNLVISNALIGRTYTNTIDGKVVSYEISNETKSIVYDCVNTFISGFSGVYKTQPVFRNAPSPRL